MNTETFYTKKDIEDIKIALISDIHYLYPNYNLNFFYKIIKQLKNNIPDYICICGDILDDSACVKLDELKNFLSEIARIAPVLVVLGNHDEKTNIGNKWVYKKNYELITILKQIKNLHLLDDTFFEDNNICFYGFNFSYSYYNSKNEEYKYFVDEANKLKTKLDSKKYNVTLFHSPINIFKFIKNNPDHNLNKTDLVLCGHMHNGGLPFFISYFINNFFNSSRSLISPSKTLFPKYAQGRIKDVKDGFVYQGVSKLNPVTGFLYFFNNFFKVKVQYLIIKKDNR